MLEISFPLHKKIDIEKLAFFGCKSLREIELPKGWIDLKGAFQGCVQLTRVKFNGEFDYMCDVLSAPYPFHGCKNLSQIDIDPSVQCAKLIDGVMFSMDGTSLYKYPPAKKGNMYMVPNFVKKIENHAFADCCIKNIALPDSVEIIGELAFAEKQLDSSFTIPDSVTTIESLAFVNTNIEKIVFCAIIIIRG